MAPESPSLAGLLVLLCGGILLWFPRRWPWSRRMAAAGAWTIAGCFFLPCGLYGHSTGWIPWAEILRRMRSSRWAEEPDRALFELGIFFLPFFTPVVIPLRHRLVAAGRNREAHSLMFGWLLFLFVSYELGYGMYFLRNREDFWSLEFLAVAGPFPLLALFLGLRQAVHDHRRASLLCQGILALGLLTFFVGHAALLLGHSLPEYYGVWVASVGAMLILAGTAGEWWVGV